MSNLDKAKQIIKEHIREARCGIYDCVNLAGDEMTTLYDDGELCIDICYGWNYFEVFGLTKSEFDELKRYYDRLLRR